MKKFFVIIFTLFLSALIIYGDNGMERYNDEENMQMVRSISKLEGVSEVALLSRNNVVLAGIIRDKNVTAESIYNEAMKMVLEKFPNAKKVVLEVGTDKAFDIIELSYYIGEDLKDSVLIKRFNYLAAT